MKEVKKQHKIIRKQKEKDGEKDNDSEEELKTTPRIFSNIKSLTRVSKASLGERLAKEGASVMVTSSGGNKEMKFHMRGKKSESEKFKKNKKHFDERRQIVRKTGFLMKKKFPKM